MSDKRPSASSMADAFLGMFPYVCFWAGNYYVLNGPCYERLEDGEFYRQLRRFVVGTLGVPEADPTYVETIALAIQHERYLRSRTTPPFWTDGRPQGHILVCQNGILDLSKFAVDDPSFFSPLDPALFSTAALPYGFDPSATCDRWRQFVDWFTSGDVTVADLHQDLFGSCLLPQLKTEKLPIQVGQGANGKSTRDHILVKMLGESNVSTVPLEQFGKRFALSSTTGKLLNLVSDAEEIDRVLEGRIKSFVSQDVLQTEEKYKNAYSIIPTAKLAVSTNTVPRFRDRSNGIWRRIVIIPCLASVTEEEANPDLVAQLATELPGILNWALIGARRVLAIRRLVIPQICQDALNEQRLLANPTRQFIDEKLSFVESDKEGIRRDWLAQEYAEWMQTLGYTGRLSMANLITELQRLFGMRVRTRKLGPRGNREPYIVAITWSRQAEKEEADFEDACAYFDGQKNTTPTPCDPPAKY